MYFLLPAQQLMLLAQQLVLPAWQLMLLAQQHKIPKGSGTFLPKCDNFFSQEAGKRQRKLVFLLPQIKAPGKDRRCSPPALLSVVARC